MNLKFELIGVEGDVVGYEYHEANKYGVVQIYHETTNPDFDPRKVMKGNGSSNNIQHENPNLFLVREGWYIPHSKKVLLKNESSYWSRDDSGTKKVSVIK